MNRTHTVMIVDDSAEDRYLLKRCLERTELSLVVMEAFGGQAGIDLLTTPVEQLETEYPGIKAPVTLFLDINMPMMNGWEFVEELEHQRHRIQLQPTVVMMYSTSDAEDDKQRATHYDIVAKYIVKGESRPDILRKAILDSQPQ